MNLASQRRIRVSLPSPACLPATTGRNSYARLRGPLRATSATPRKARHEEPQGQHGESMTANLKKKPRRQCVGLSTTDRTFDELVPSELRHLSQSHWTPVDVAIRAAKLLSPTRDVRILDIGAGVGKLCSVGALSSPATWCGVEQHELLVTTARGLARAFGVADRTMFVHGDAFSIDWDDFDAVYLYNPFELPLFAESTDAENNALESRVQVTRTQERLAALRTGTRVVTFHGFGGVMPPSYELASQERVPIVGLDLVLWIQGSRIRRTMELS
jgi:predicted RNA methylase